MRSTGSRRVFQVWSSACALLVLAIACVVAAPVRALPLPSPLPKGFRVERHGGVRWLFPAAAESEVAELERDRRTAWAALETELGAPLPGELDLRVGVNPAQMQALSPGGRTLPSYATAVAFAEDGVVLLSMTEPESWLRPNLKQVFVHELSHVALQRAVGGQSLPRWFAEGVAIHQSNEHSLARVRTLWEGTLREELIPLERISAGFPARHGQVDLAYAEAADLVGHMLEGERGPLRFAALITHLRERQPFEAAFEAVYGMPLRELELQWHGQLRQRFGRWPSILSGLTVLWAGCALLLVVGYVRVRRKHRRTLKRWAIEEAPVLASEPPPAPPPIRSVADHVLDAWYDQARSDSGVPTIVHEGRSYTLH